MKKFGWEFQAARAAIDGFKEFSMALEIFERHFVEHSDFESAIRFIRCCRYLRDYRRGNEFIARHRLTAFDEKMREEIFLLRYDDDVGRNMRLGRWECALDSIEIVLQEPENVPESLLVQLRLDQIRAACCVENWKTAYEAFNHVDIHQEDPGQRRVCRELRLRSYMGYFCELMRENELEKALDVIGSVQVVFPGNVELARKKALCLHRLGRHQEAAEGLKRFAGPKAGWNLNYTLSRYMTAAERVREAKYYGALAVTASGRMSAKLPALIHLMELYRNHEDSEYFEMLVAMVVRLQQSFGRPVKGRLKHDYNVIASRYGEIETEALEYLLLQYLKSDIEDVEVHVARGYLHGSIDMTWENSSFYRIIPENFQPDPTVNYCVLKTDVPDLVLERGGRLIFRCGSDVFSQDGKDWIPVASVLPDTIANRAAHTEGSSSCIIFEPLPTLD